MTEEERIFKYEHPFDREAIRTHGKIFADLSKEDQIKVSNAVRNIHVKVPIMRTEG